MDVSDIRVSMFYISLQMYTFSVKYNTFPAESVYSHHHKFRRKCCR